MILRSALFALCGLAALTLAALPARAQLTTAMTGITISSGGARLVAQYRCIGFEFTPTADLLVSQLGVYDHNQDGLNGLRTTGIFQKTGQTLLTSTSIGTTDTLDGLFRYKSITPITLFAGQTYAVVAQFTTADNDFYLAEADAYTPAGALSYTPATGAVYSGIINDTFFTYPIDTIANRNGHFSANFKFTSSAAAPEPGSLALLGLAALPVALIVRRRKLEA